MSDQAIQAELRFLFSPDADPLKDYHPAGPFGILVMAIVGPRDSEGEESFDFMLCTPDWFERDRLGEGAGIAIGRHFVFVREFNYQALELFVAKYCAQCRGRTWAEVAEKVARLGHWEFEDYSDGPGPRGPG